MTACALRRRRAARTGAVGRGRRAGAGDGWSINGSVGLVQQRLLAPTTTAAERASFVRTAGRHRSASWGASRTGSITAALLPSRSLGPAGDLFVLGRCDGLYVQGFDGSWLPVERSAIGLHGLASASGSCRFRPPGGVPLGGGPQALLTLGPGPRRVTVVARDTARAGRLLDPGRRPDRGPRCPGGGRRRPVRSG